MRFVGRGHPAVRATHAKTLELTPDADLTARGTCIVAVGAEAEPAGPLAGPVRIRISAGGERFGFDAVANSSWDPAGPVVIRRSALRLPGTFATGATAAAADLPRALVAALTDPDALVTVDVVAIPTGEQTVVLLAVDPTGGGGARMRAELKRADTVVVEDAAARRFFDDQQSDADPLRTLVVAANDLPGASVLPLLASADRIETVGLPARLAVAAASPSRGPLLIAPDGSDPRELLRRTPAGHRLVLSLDLRHLDGVLALAADVRGGEVVVAQEYRHPTPVVGGELPELSGSDPVHCCFGPRRAGVGDSDEVAAIDRLDPTVRAAVDALLSDGVATKTTARALAALTGWDRRRAYAAVVAWAATSGG